MTFTVELTIILLTCLAPLHFTVAKCGKKWEENIFKEHTTEVSKLSKLKYSFINLKYITFK